MRRGKPTYIPAPALTPALAPRLTAIVEVMAGVTTVSQAARRLGLSRPRFQSLLHRGLAALIQGIAIKRAGRPPTPPPMSALQREVRRLQRENRRLRRQVDSTEQLLQVASGLLKGRLRASGRQRGARRTTGASRTAGATRTTGASRARADEPEPGAHRAHLLAGVAEMSRLGLTRRAACAFAGIDAATERRWRTRAARAASPPRVRAPGTAPRAVTEVEQLVRTSRGLIGAEALRHSVPGLSRRVAARVKADTLTRLERERKAALTRVELTVPGIVRGLDALDLCRARDPRYLLIAADAAIPYRTSLGAGPRYDAALVTRVIGADFERHGVPLVLRLDRARVHTAQPVRALLAAHGVLALHGPPYCARFYGQLERQNREHRAWLDATLALEGRLDLAALEQMLATVNVLWRRRTLDWHTAAELWNARPPLRLDHHAFLQEVQARSARVAQSLSRRGQPADLAERIAVERTLERMGYLRLIPGGWC